ncbi:MAG TPA: tetratricopeptide repeat protein [Elusimicrobiota bacterium]|nr:tetratricopeptide repeat protein [Elusimicrobiota bacterium]
MKLTSLKFRVPDAGARSRTFLWGLTAVLVAAACLAAFFPALHNDFVSWDDPDNFLNNPRYRGLGRGQLLWIFTATHMGHYIPVTWLTLAADHALWGMNPFGYHLTSLLFHMANALLVLSILRPLLRLSTEPLGIDVRPNPREMIGLGTAALFFAIHPLRVESVVWISERRDVVSGFFYLSSLLCYLRYAQTDERTRSGRGWWYGASVGLFLLMVLSRANNFTLLATLFLLDFYPLRRLRWPPTAATRGVLFEKIPYVLLVLLALASLTVSQNRIGSLQTDVEVMNATMAQTFFGLVFHIKKTFLPLHLAPVYGAVRAGGLAEFLWLNGGLLAALTAFLVWMRKKWPAAMAAWLHFIVTLLPPHLSGRANSITNDRYGYLASLSASVILLAVLKPVWENNPVSGSPPPGRKTLLVLLSAALLTGLGTLTFRQCRVWRDSETLWRHTVAADVHSPIPYHNLAVTLQRKGQLPQAVSLYTEGLRLFPEAPLLYYGRAGTDLASGKIDEAKKRLRQAVELNPSYGKAYQKLGDIALSLGDLRSAYEHYTKALRLRPTAGRIHSNLGYVCLKLGRNEEAERHLREALQRDPDDAEALNNLGILLLSQGRWPEAEEIFRRGLANSPDSYELHTHLGNTLLRMGRVSEGWEHLEHALRLNPRSKGAHFYAGAALMDMGRFPEAEKHFEAALDLDPHFEAARQQLKKFPSAKRGPPGR